MAFQVTQAHQDIFDAVESGSRSIQIEAVAGSGKTSTIVEALKLVGKFEKVVFLAFNVSIKKELESRVPKHVDCKTLNGLGHRAWWKHLASEGVIRGWRDVNVNKDKVRNIMLDLEDERELTPVEVSTYGWTAVRLANMAKGYGLIPDDKPRRGLIPDSHDSWWAMIDKHDVELPDVDGAFDRVVGLARRFLRKNNEMLDKIDFNDQLYLPYVYDVRCFKYDRVLVDEAQDLSPLQHDLLAKSLKKTGQLIAVGDPRQAIYGFRGADAASMENLHERFGTVKLPLHVSYRCPRKVVELAQTVVEHIQPHDDAEEGLVDLKPVPSAEAEFKGGDLVMCRTTAPVVGLAYSLIRQSRPAEVLGRDIGAGLTALIKKLRPTDIDDLLTRLRKWEDREIEKANKRRASESKIMAIQDKADTLRVLADVADSLAMLSASIKSLFSGDRNPTKVTLCTVHKAKGLEANRVWVLNPHLMPHPMAKQAWAREQEMNLIYVAYTRAKKELRFAIYAGKNGV